MLDEVTENKFHHWGNQNYSDIHAKKKLIKKDHFSGFFRIFFMFFLTFQVDFTFFLTFPDFSG